MHRMVRIALVMTGLALAVSGSAESAQPPADGAPGALVAVPFASTKPAGKARECTRLPLSDIQAGREKTIEVARIRLGEYADKVAKQKGWKSWEKSLETVSCAEYLWVPIIGQEYKCLITATFCKRT